MGKSWNKGLGGNGVLGPDHIGPAKFGIPKKSPPKIPHQKEIMIVKPPPGCLIGPPIAPFDGGFYCASAYILFGSVSCAAVVIYSSNAKIDGNTQIRQLLLVGCHPRWHHSMGVIIACLLIPYFAASQAPFSLFNHFTTG